ncbi:hypothetical protein B0H66DRAFT_478961 [Apodospora peruviana]|uniref:Uncharacterized protein n=1 Tax=Apodospora peruviana TaxID=516989 RepID=A0AAE0M377_9PEZI|nr:hypothetical protein B0H66DRAFT_478961 [Apodospora peruviana]
MSSLPVKRVAVIGAGPSGAITLDALARENAFDIIRVFERREGPGGCWIGDKTRPPTISDIGSLADRTADPPLPVPDKIPAQTPKSDRPRFTESSVYPYLETNVDALPMEFTQEPFPTQKSEQSIAIHGQDTPFRHWKLVQAYINSLVDRKGYEDLVSYDTTVERVEKIGAEWKVTLRKEGKESTDYWWTEWFDAVVVASGHYWVPYIPAIDGLAEFEKARPGSVIHSKHFRGRNAFRGKRVVVVGASVSAADIAFDLAHSKTAQTPVHTITIGRNANGYFGGEAFKHPRIAQHPSIARIEGRTVHLIDGNCIPEVDAIIFGTGYSWTLPFLQPQVEVRNNRVPELYQHVVWQRDPTLLFVGAVAAGLTFKIFEWQAVLAARILAGRVTLPPLQVMREWEAQRIKQRGDGVRFSLIAPDFEDYFEEVRKLAGDGGEKGVGRRLPKFRREWIRAFMEGHERRKEMWRALNAKARAEEDGTSSQAARPRAHL